MSVSWPVWARGVKGLTPSQSLVLFELASRATAHTVVCARTRGERTVCV